MQYKSRLFIPMVIDWCAHVIAFTAMRPSTIYLRIPFLLLELNMRLYPDNDCSMFKPYCTIVRGRLKGTATVYKSHVH